MADANALRLTLYAQLSVSVMVSVFESDLNIEVYYIHLFVSLYYVMTNKYTHCLRIDVTRVTLLAEPYVWV